MTEAELQLLKEFGMPIVTAIAAFIMGHAQCKHHLKKKGWHR